MVGVSGIAVGLSNYSNAKMLYQLTHVTGELRVILDGNIVTVILALLSRVWNQELHPGGICSMLYNYPLYITLVPSCCPALLELIA